MASSACSPIEPLKTEVKASRERLVPDTFTGYHEVPSLAQVLDLADAKVKDTKAWKHFVTRKCVGKPHPFERVASKASFLRVFTCLLSRKRTQNQGGTRKRTGQV